LRRMRFAMGIQSYFCCLTASRLPGNGIVEGSSRSRWLHYAPAMKVLRIRKCLIVSTRSVRRASGLLETGIPVTSPCSLAAGNLLKIRLCEMFDCYQHNEKKCLPENRSQTRGNKGCADCANTYSYPDARLAGILPGARNPSEEQDCKADQQVKRGAAVPTLCGF